MHSKSNRDTEHNLFRWYLWAPSTISVIYSHMRQGAKQSHNQRNVEKKKWIDRVQSRAWVWLRPPDSHTNSACRLAQRASFPLVTVIVRTGRHECRLGQRTRGKESLMDGSVGVWHVSCGVPLELSDVECDTPKWSSWSPVLIRVISYKEPRRIPKF